MSDNNGHWFVYSRSAGRFSAAPLNWKGWAALIVTLGVTIAGGRIVSSFVVRWGPIAHLVGLAAMILSGGFVIVRLVLAKGKAAQ
ncbi:hypothetical protein [Novosphingobium sp.]|uniref:hypothetical protein n=1 Tax=Novosphingobium sp. TaxID=1874826 RepID=UPI002621679E|nr:hypothetical protein [Novosphingobium sp.]